LFACFSQAGASEASLRFMYKNNESVWTAPDGGSTIDMGTKVVTAITTHFGEWGLFGDVLIFSISITANTDHAPFELADGTKLVIKGTADAEVRPSFLRLPQRICKSTNSPPCSATCHLVIHPNGCNIR